MIFRRKPRRSFGKTTSPRRKRPARARSSVRPSAPTRLKRRSSAPSQRKKNIGKTLIASLDNFKTKKRKPLARGFFAKLKRLVLIILIGSAAFFIVYNLFISDKLAIHTVAIFEDQQPLPEHPLTQILGEFKNSNLLLLNTDRIEIFLRKKYPYYADIQIHKTLPDTLVLNLKTHPIVARLIVETLEGKDQLILSTAGQAQYTDDENAYAELPTLFIEEPKKIPQGTQIISQEHLAFILEAMQNFEDKFGMTVEFTQYNAIPREAHLYTERGFYVWFDLSMDLDEQLDKLKKSLPRLNIYEETLEYIDLRISGINGDKVIFKQL
jgi:hypothetical protein